MSEFHTFSTAIHARFNELAKGELFVVGSEQPTKEQPKTIKERLWDTYLESFPAGTNPIFRVNTEHDCACCRNFIKNIGNAVAIIDGDVATVWDVHGLPEPYATVAKAMHEFVVTKKITGVFRRSEQQYGKDYTRETMPDGKVHRWHHFHATLTNKHYTRDVGAVLGQINDTIQVFQRALDTFTPEAFTTVLDLIKSNSLYRGEEHLEKIKGFQKLFNEYRKLKTAKAKTIFVYTNYTIPYAKFRNEAIGTLFKDLCSMVPVEEGSEEMKPEFTLEQAVGRFEFKVAGPNYKRTTALITPRMVEDAMKTIQELDLEDSLQRRYAKLSDVSANNVLWVDNSVKSRMKGGVAGLLMETARANTSVDLDKRKAETVSIAEFMENILPKATALDVFVKNSQLGNFMSLTAPVHEDSTPLFKWDNNFAWSYDGDITDTIREKVKKAGGNVDGKLRFSLAWFNTDDLDLHLRTPNGAHISFRDRHGQGGHLDVDANGMDGIRPDPVENIAFNYPRDGEYTVWVNQYSKRQNNDVGFTMQIASVGQVKEFNFPYPVSGDVKVGTFTVKNGEIVSVTGVDERIKADGISKEKWGINTEQFVPVQTVMYSPNYWDGNATGNKHWFFMLAGCKNPEPTRGIYNEFLLGHLDKHRKVFEVLGDKIKCPVADEQLSGVGFSSTIRATVTVLVKTERAQKLYNVNF